MSLYKQVKSESQIQSLLDDAGGVALLFFHANWCGPCRFIHSYIKETTEENEILLMKIDVDESEQLTEAYGVSAMPTYIGIEGKSRNKVCKTMGGSKLKVDEAINELKLKTKKTTSK